MKRRELHRRIGKYLTLSHLDIDFITLLHQGKSDKEILDEFDRSCIDKMIEIAELRRKAKNAQRNTIEQ